MMTVASIPTITVGGMTIPVLGLGTRQIGGALEADMTHDDYRIQGLRDAIDMGYTRIDTAELYGAGHCEELIGHVIAGYDRSSLFVGSKVFRDNANYDDVLRSCEQSLQRLGIDYLDMYLLHSPSRHVPLRETMRAFDRLVDEGVVRHIGVTDFNVALLQEAQSYAQHKIANNMIEYSLLTRNSGKTIPGMCNMESDIIPYCQQHDIVVSAQRPIERGLLAKPGYAVLDRLVKKYNKTHAQIAINRLLSKKNIVTIPKSSHKARLQENLGAIGWEMDADDYRLLDETVFASSE